MNTHSTNRLQTGLSMIELLVALAIGSFLIIGAVTVQSQTRKTFDVNEQQARLQESARYVLSVLEPDLQMAGLYGFTQDPNAVMWSDPTRALSDPEKLTPPSDLHVDGTAPGMPDTLDDCGGAFALDVLATVTATNGAFDLDCAAEGGGQVVGTDTLMLRHASTVDTVATDSKLQIFSSPTSPFTQTRLSVADDDVESGNAQAGIEGAHSVRDMIVQAYYIATNADGHAGVPAMRRKVLDSDGAAPLFRDQEMIRGIEDLQIQFGVDPGADVDGDGEPDDPGEDGMADYVNGFAAQYVNPGDPILASAQVVAVRVWVRVRADQPEPGFKDERVYTYADTEFEADDRFRRVLMSRTIFLRNSRQQ
jgi:type IV pilus assembly protein PilW